MIDLFISDFLLGSISNHKIAKPFTQVQNQLAFFSFNQVSRYHTSLYSQITFFVLLN